MPFLGGRGQSSKGFFGGGTIPDAPTSLVSTPGNGQLSIAFIAPTFDGGLPITNYEWSINAGSTWTAFSPADIISPVVITGLTNGSPYIVYLRAVNSLGSGKTSAALSTNTTPYTVPTAPTSLSSTAGNTQLTISFTAPSTNGGNAITNYEYALSINSGSTYGSWTALFPSDTLTPITITGLTNGQAYYVKLRAVTGLTTGNESVAVAINTMPFTTPTAPTSLVSTPGNAQLSIAFTAPTSSGGPAITNYEYALSTNSGSTYGAWTAISPADALTPVVITGLTNGTAYYVKLRAITTLANGAESVAVFANTTPFTVPTAPTTLVSTAGNTSLSIAFTTPSDNGGFAITNYQYAVSTNSGSTYGSWTAISPLDATSPVTVPSLTNGTAYYVKLRAVTSVSIGVESLPVSTNTTPFTNPDAPTLLSSVAGNTQLQISFTPGSSGGPAITNYEYALSTNSGSTYGAWIAVSPVDPSSPVTITGLTNGQGYYVKLRAITSLANGTESAPVTTNTMPFTTPAAPTSLVSTAGNGSLSIAFTAGNSGGPAITNYEYQTSTNGGVSYGAWTALSPADALTPVTIPSLINGVAYYVKLRAITSLANGAESVSVSTNTTPFTTPTAPTALSSTAGNGQLQIAFTAPSNPGGFAIANYEYALSTNSGSTYGAWTSLSPADNLTPVTIPSLTNGTAYYVKLRAISSAPATGAESTAVTTNTTPYTVPSQPAAPTVAIGTGADTIDDFTWVAPSNGGSPITQYGLQASFNAGSTWGDEVLRTDTNNLTLATETAYISFSAYLRVRAYNAAGAGLWSLISPGTRAWVLGASTQTSTCASFVCSCGSCDSCGTNNGTNTTATQTRSCYTWTRTGSNTSGYYNSNGTTPCDATYTACSGGTCDGCIGCSGDWVDYTATGCYTETYGYQCYTGFQEFFGSYYMYWNSNPQNSGACSGSYYYGFTREYCSVSASYRIVPQGCKDSRTK